MLTVFEMDLETLNEKIKNTKKEIEYVKSENPDWQNCALSLVMIQELREDLKASIDARNCLENINFEDYGNE